MMAKKLISDKKVVQKIAKILVARLKDFSLPADQDAEAAIRSIIEEKAYPLISYGDLAKELNLAFGLEDAPVKFTPLRIDDFLVLLLKESIVFEYGGVCVVHNGRIRKKLGCDVPITAIVVNGTKHIPGGKFFTYFKKPHTTFEECLDTEVELLETLFRFSDWSAYLQRLQKVFGK